MKLPALITAATCLCLAINVCPAQDANNPPNKTLDLSSLPQQPPIAPMDAWKATRDQQPAGLHLTLSLPKTHFHLGEIIPATLLHSNDSPNPYYLWIGTYDRSGRIRDLGFTAVGEGGQLVPDPLEYYFTHYLMMGGGLGNTQNLKAWEFTLPANQWLRFEKPGKYRIYAHSSRVRPGDRDALREREPANVTLVSDPVEITIDPLTPEQEAAIFAAAKNVSTEMKSVRSDDDAYRAIQQLRFLDTPTAREALLPYLDSPYASEATLALYASKDYAGTAARLLEAVSAGQLGLSQTLVHVYSNLKGGGSSATNIIWEKTPRDSAAVAPPTYPQDELYAGVRRSMATDGTGPVFFANLLTLFQRNPADPQVRALFIRHQLDLPEKQIAEAFQKKDLLADREFLPLLRSLVTPEKHSAEALTALAAVAPDEARPIILADIRRPQPLYLSRSAYPYSALLTLPEPEIPELDAVLREKLPRSTNSLEGMETVLALVDRYATKALLPDVKAIYASREGYWACSLQSYTLRYWIRCDPVEGVAALARALTKSKKENTACYHTTLSDVLNKRWVPEALPLVLEATRHESVEVVRSAAAVLRAHAGPEAIPPLIAAVEDLSARPLPTNVGERNEQLYVPIEITRSLLTTPRWTLTREQLERLQKAVIDKNLQAELKVAVERLN